MKPDFAAVDSVAKATTLAAQGRLVPILLFPEEFGGENRVENRVYITPEAAEARTLILGTMKRMARDGALNQLTVEPDYKGVSVIPSRIRFKAWHNSKKGSFEPTIEIW